MASKVIYCPNSSSYGYTINVTFSESNVNIANNTSVISISGYISATNVGFNENNSCPLTISWHDDSGIEGQNGNVKSIDVHQVGYNSGGPNTVYISGSRTVTHKGDGSLSGYATISFTKHAWASGWVPSSNSVSTGNTKLTTIARKSSIKECTQSWADGSDWVRTEIKSASSNFRHTVTITLGNYSKSESNVATTSKIVIPKDWCNAMPNSTSGTATVTVATYSYNGGTHLGSVSTTTTIKVPGDVVPSLTQPTTGRIDNGVPSSWGVYVKGYSQVYINIPSISGSYGSSVKNFNITGTNMNVSGSSGYNGTSGVIWSSGTQTYTCKITDSRGRTASKTVSIDVKDYYAPSVSVSAERCDSAGNITADGTSLKVTGNYSYASVGGNNSITSKSISCNGVSSNSFSTSGPTILQANCSIGSVYTLNATVTDGLGRTATATVEIPTAHRIINVKKDKKGIAFGGFSQKDAMEVFMDTCFNKNVNFKGDMYYNKGPILIDTRSVNESPLYYKDKIGYDSRSGIYGSGSIYEFKYCSAIGLTKEWISTTYCTLITMKPWGDPSGGPIRQLAFPDGYNTFFSRLSNSDWSGWSPWDIIEADSCWLRNKTWDHLTVTNKIIGNDLESRNTIKTKEADFIKSDGVLGGRIFKNVDFNITSTGNGGGKLCLQDRGYSIFYEGIPQNNWTSGKFFPGASGCALGKSGAAGGRWYRLYASHPCDISSDERLKTHIQKISDYIIPINVLSDNVLFKNGQKNLFESIYMDLMPKTYFMKDDEIDRAHIGFIAQDVAKALEKHGCSEKDLDLINHIYWIDDDTGEQKDEYSLRYEEFIALNTYMTQQCVKKIASLEKEIEQLKLKQNKEDTLSKS